MKRDKRRGSINLQLHWELPAGGRPAVRQHAGIIFLPFRQISCVSHLASLFVRPELFDPRISIRWSACPAAPVAATHVASAKSRSAAPTPYSCRIIDSPVLARNARMRRLRQQQARVPGLRPRAHLPAAGPVLVQTAQLQEGVPPRAQEGGPLLEQHDPQDPRDPR